jgi:hypothetical protein
LFGLDDEVEDDDELEDITEKEKSCLLEDVQI